ncbi:MAG: DUF3068 domain-containing protein [Mycobacterium sp.]
MNRAVMLRIAACGILGLGSALLIAALLLSTYTGPRISKIPLDINAELISTRSADDPPATALDPASMEPALAPQAPQVEGDDAPRPLSFVIDDDVDVVMQQQMSTELPANADYVTQQVGTTVRRVGDQQDDGNSLLLAMVDRFTLDRSTALPVQVADDRVGLEVPQVPPAEDPDNPTPPTQTDGTVPTFHGLDRTGLNYRFPFDVEKKTYPYFDPVAQQAFGANYEGEEDVNGLTAYRFTQNIGYDAAGNLTPVYDDERQLLEPVRYESLYDEKIEEEFTATNRQWGLQGEPDEQLTLTRYYAAQRTFWVDPVSGTIVKQREHAFHYYASDPLEPLRTVVDYTVTYDEQTVEQQVASASDQRDRISLYSRILPITFIAAGLIALVGGALLGAFGLRAESALIDPGLDSAEHGFFGSRGGAPPDRVPGAEAETEKIPAQRPADLPPPGNYSEPEDKPWP